MASKKQRTNWFGTHKPTSVMRAGVWSAFGNGSQAVIQLVSAVILSRLIKPAEFGKLALVMVFYNLLSQVTGYAMSMATVQKADLTERQASNCFWVNIVVTGCLGLLLAGMGPALAAFYHERELISISVAFGVLLWLDGWASQHRALLMRAMRFDLMFWTQVGAALPGLALGVMLALEDLAYGRFWHKCWRAGCFTASFFSMWCVGNRFPMCGGAASAPCCASGG